MLSDGAGEVYEAYTTTEISSDALLYHRSWPMALNTLIQQFLTGKVVQKAHELPTRASHQPHKSKREFETQIFVAKKQCRHIFTPIKRVANFRGSKPSVLEDMWKEPRLIPLEVRSSPLILDILLLHMAALSTR